MEQFKVDIKDLRQSEKWAEYLKTLGWFSARTSKGTNIEFIKSGLGCVAKVQRPHVLDKSELSEIDTICMQNKAVFTKLEPSLYQDMALLKAHGYLPSKFPLVPPSTIYLNLKQSEEELWGNVSHGGKYSINRAKREHAQVGFYRNPPEDILRQFNEVAVETGKKKSFYVQVFDELLCKARLFGDEGFVVIVKDKNGALASAMFFLGYEGSIWYLHGGTTEKGRKQKAGYALVWESLLYFKKLGYGILDLEGIWDPRFPLYTHNWEGLTHFKEKFGGMSMRMPAPQTKIYNPILQKMAKYLPLPF